MIYYVDKFQLLAVLNGCARNLSVSYLLAAYGEGNKSESQKNRQTHAHTKCDCCFESDFCYSV